MEVVTDIKSVLSSLLIGFWSEIAGSFGVYIVILLNSQHYFLYVVVHSWDKQGSHLLLGFQ